MTSIFTKKKDKYHTGVYLNREIYDRAVALAKQNGLSVNQTLCDLIEAGIRAATHEG